MLWLVSSNGNSMLGAWRLPFCYKTWQCYLLTDLGLQEDLLPFLPPDSFLSSCSLSGIQWSTFDPKIFGSSSWFCCRWDFCLLTWLEVAGKPGFKIACHENTKREKGSSLQKLVKLQKDINADIFLNTGENGWQAGNIVLACKTTGRAFKTKQTKSLPQCPVLYRTYKISYDRLISWKWRLN